MSKTTATVLGVMRGLRPYYGHIELYVTCSGIATGSRYGQLPSVTTTRTGISGWPGYRIPQSHTIPRSTHVP